MSGISAGGYALLGLTAVVAALVAVLAYAAMRFAAAAREARRQIGDGRTEQALLSSALTDAIGRLREQERRMTDRAEQSERLSSQIVASLTSGLIVVDPDRTARIVNPAAVRLLALDGAASGTRVFDRPDLAPLGEVVAVTLETGAPVTRRTVALELERGTCHVGVTVSPLVERAGQAAVCLFSDLTDVFDLEEQVRLKEALARLGELTAGLAHEFRNGLATVRGYGQLLGGEPLGEPADAYVSAVRDEVDSLGHLVDRFLDFARPEPLSRVPLALEPVVRAAVADAISAQGSDPLCKSVSVDGRFGQVEGNEILLRQAFANLIRNGVEACREAGRPPRVDVTGDVDAGRRTVRITVADAGPGLHARVADRLFRPFVTTRASGTGLGLAVVQKVVVGHNGRVSGANHPDGGAVFTVTLPLHTVDVTHTGDITRKA